MGEIEVDEKIVQLIRLQEVDTQLNVLSQSKQKVGPQRDAVKQEIQALLARAEEAKKSLTQAQVDKKNLELDIENKDQAIRKSGGELNSVKTNDAYKALLKQIDDAKTAKSQLEDKILELMERIDQLQKELKEGEKKIQQDKSVLEKKIADLDAEEKRISDEIDKKKAEREQVVGAIQPAARDLYHNIQRGRTNFTVLVPIKGNICGGCRTILPPTVINEVMKGKEIITCDTCSRILHIPPAAPAKPEEGAPVPS